MRGWIASVCVAPVGSGLSREGYWARLPETALPGSTFLLSLIYGVGTALPVLPAAFLLAYSAQSAGKNDNILSKVEWGPV